MNVRSCSAYNNKHRDNYNTSVRLRSTEHFSIFKLTVVVLLTATLLFCFTFMAFMGSRYFQGNGCDKSTAHYLPSSEW